MILGVQMILTLKMGQNLLSSLKISFLKQKTIATYQVRAMFGLMQSPFTDISLLITLFRNSSRRIRTRRRLEYTQKRSSEPS